MVESERAAIVMNLATAEAMQAYVPQRYSPTLIGWVQELTRAGSPFRPGGAVPRGN